jgi:hypothetical protein
MPLVFQYGSNCDASRLNAPERLSGRARDLGRAETADEFEIAFDVWSQGNACAASDLVAVPGTGLRVWGVLYEIPTDLIRGRRNDGCRTLEQIEGRRYGERQIRVRKSCGEEVDATTFLVKPQERQTGLWTRADYVRHIVTGLRTHEVREDYVEHVIDIAIRTNHQAVAGAAEQTRLIDQLRKIG